MRNRGFILIGGFLVVWGLLILIGNLLHINFWNFCWPVGLILIGVWLLLRPRLMAGNSRFNFSPLNNTRRSGEWQVASEEIYTLVGDTRLDFSQAQLPPGETILRIFGFVGDLKLYLPTDLAFSLTSWAFYNESRLADKKEERFLSPVDFTTSNYENAEKKVRLETYFFVMDLRLNQV